MVVVRIPMIVTAGVAVAIGFIAAVSALLTGIGHFGSQQAVERVALLIWVLPLLAMGVAAPLVVNLTGRTWQIAGAAAWGTLLVAWYLVTAREAAIPVWTIGRMELQVGTSRDIVLVGASLTLLAASLAAGFASRKLVRATFTRKRRRQGRPSQPVPRALTS